MIRAHDMTFQSAVMSRRAFARAPFEARVQPPLPPGDVVSVAPADCWIRVYRRAMACRFEVVLPGEHADGVPAARAALDAVDAIEARLTVFRDTSDVVRLNRTAAVAAAPVDEDLFALVQCCQQLHADTEGAFDITSMPLSRCWGFLRRSGRLPSADELAAVCRSVGMRHVVADSTNRTIGFARENVELNFGAIGKGWALDGIAEGLAMAVPAALLSAGRSSVRTVNQAGRLASGDLGRGWLIDLTSPRLDRPLAHVWLRSGALGTSGAGEQFFEVDGKRYGHVIDPRTGWPADGALSVSVIARDAACADALSTAFFVGGIDLARRYCARHPSVLVVFTPDVDRPRPLVIGEYRDADVEVG
jgi:thiamine biosynthesis lipoprotein